MATVTKGAKTFALACPFCDESDAINLNLNNLHECVCSNCDTEFSVDEAIAKLAEQLEKWRKVQTWISTAPVAD